MGTAMDHAIGLYMDGIRDGRPREAVEAHTGARYTQHSTGVADGKDGFVDFFEDFLERNPERDIRIVRALQDGRWVFLQAHQVLNGGTARWVTTDFFDSDEDGRIVEHWDVIAAETPPNPAGRTQVDGPTAVVDRDRTEANKAVVADFVQACLVEGALDRAGEFVSAERFHAHHPGSPDGLDAYVARLRSGDRPLTYEACVLLVGEGCFVATLCRAKAGDEPLCQVDLFRLEDGRIVEHWDNAEPVPPREARANSGKF